MLWAVPTYRVWRVSIGLTSNVVSLVRGLTSSVVSLFSDRYTSVSSVFFERSIDAIEEPVQLRYVSPVLPLSMQHY